MNMENRENSDKVITACLFIIILLPVVFLIKQRIEQAPKIEVTQAEKQNPNKTAAFNACLNQGLEYYYAKEYEKSIESTKKAIALNPKNSSAYNNLCSAYNELYMWEKAIEACSLALKIDSNFTLAKNNLNWAKNNLNQ
jgi:tetratricopeptide (TPR) repeat protein